MAAISIRGLAKTYTAGSDAQAALSALDLEIEDSKFITLLGPSGCGKTTTLRLIAGYLKPDAGTIHVGGRLLSSKTQVISPENRGMGMVFQNYAVWPHKTVYENIAFGLKLRRIPKPEMERKIGTALDNVNLRGLEHRFPSELSGGQQQRVALARSLVVEPDILLLDEPLSNLDAKLRERMRVELKELQRRTGITFIYVTHDQSEALALSDQIAVMHGGKLQQYGTPFDVYSRPVNRTVADFMGLVNILRGRIAGSPPVLEITGVPVADAALPDWARAGQAVDIAVRPENIRLSTVASPNGVPGTIIDHTFLGNIAEYMVEIAGGQKLRVQTHPLQVLQPGDTVTVELDLATSSIFPSAENSAAQLAA